MEENLENFENFVENSKKDIEVNIEEPEIEVNEIVSLEQLDQADGVLCCPYDNYIPRSHCKDKRKAIIRHIKKKHPEKLAEYLRDYPEQPKAKPKSQNQKLNTIIEEINDSSKIVESEDERKLKLIGDLDILKAKFPTLYKCPSYSYPESSIEHLERIKNTYTRLINDKLSCKVLFNCLVAVGKGAEQFSDSMNICDLEGYAGNIQENQPEIEECIQELIDSNTIDLEISPEMKLGLCLVNIGIKTAEANKLKKKSISLENVVP